MRKPLLIERARYLILIVGVLGLLGMLPPPLQIAWLRVLRDQLHPLHHGLPEVMREIAALEAAR